MQKKISLWALSGALLFVATACVSSQFSSLQYGVDTASYSEVGKIDTRVQVLEFLGGAAGGNLFNITASKSDEVTKAAIQAEIEAAGGTAARDIKLVHKATFGNLLVNWLTVNIIAPSVVEVSGTIIKDGASK
ncbi:MAG: hypothetical protein AAF975_03195 [Spirochaetota bacterium]